MISSLKGMFHARIGVAELYTLLFLSFTCTHLLTSFRPRIASHCRAIAAVCPTPEFISFIASDQSHNHVLGGVRHIVSNDQKRKLLVSELLGLLNETKRESDTPAPREDSSTSSQDFQNQQHQHDQPNTSATTTPKPSLSLSLSQDPATPAYTSCSQTSTPTHLPLSSPARALLSPCSLRSPSRTPSKLLSATPSRMHSTNAHANAHTHSTNTSGFSNLLNAAGTIFRTFGSASTEIDRIKAAAQEQSRLTKQLSNSVASHARDCEMAKIQAAQLEQYVKMHADEEETNGTEVDVLPVAKLDFDTNAGGNAESVATNNPAASLSNPKNNLAEELSTLETTCALLEATMRSPSKSAPMDCEETGGLLHATVHTFHPHAHANGPATPLHPSPNQSLNQSLSNTSFDMAVDTRSVNGADNAIEASYLQIQALLQENEKRVEEAVEAKRIAEESQQFVLSHLQSFRQELAALKSQSVEVIHAAQQTLQSQGSFLFEKIQESLQLCQEVNRRFLKEQSERKRLQQEVAMLRGNIRVIARIRPALPTETSQGDEVVIEGVEENKLVIHGATVGAKLPQDISSTAAYRAMDTRVFEFDKVLDAKSSQVDVFHEVKDMITATLDGFHACIFAYGQTGSGKTHTMLGSPNDRGLYYTSLFSLFESISQRSAERYSIAAQMIEIYNENIRDLLAPQGGSGATDLEIKQGPDGLHLPEATNELVNCPEDVLRVLERGQASRAVGKTKCNERSSRSHSLLLLSVRGEHKLTGKKSFGRLVLVDLAGSERVSRSGAEGDRLKEAQAINKSLSALGDVIAALQAKQSHIPFRNSKLTHLLMDSLGKENLTLMIVQVAPTLSHRNESVSSLTFAQRVNRVELGKAQKHVDTAEMLKWKNEAKRAEMSVKLAEQEVLVKEEKHMDTLKKVESLESEIQTLRAEIASLKRRKISHTSSYAAGSTPHADTALHTPMHPLRHMETPAPSSTPSSTAASSAPSTGTGASLAASNRRPIRRDPSTLQRPSLPSMEHNVASANENSCANGSVSCAKLSGLSASRPIGRTGIAPSSQRSSQLRSGVASSDAQGDKKSSLLPAKRFSFESFEAEEGLEGYGRIVRGHSDLLESEAEEVPDVECRVATVHSNVEPERTLATPEMPYDEDGIAGETTHSAAEEPLECMYEETGETPGTENGTIPSPTAYSAPSIPSFGVDNSSTNTNASTTNTATPAHSVPSAAAIAANPRTLARRSSFLSSANGVPSNSAARSVRTLPSASTAASSSATTAASSLASSAALSASSALSGSTGIAKPTRVGALATSNSSMSRLAGSASHASLRAARTTASDASASQASGIPARPTRSTRALANISNTAPTAAYGSGASGLASETTAKRAERGAVSSTASAATAIPMRAITMSENTLSNPTVANAKTSSGKGASRILNQKTASIAG